MSTTSLKLPDDVKQLAAAAAKQQGVTPHAFMVDAIRAAAMNAERRAGFVADAIASRKETVKSGKGYAAEDVHAYLRVRAKGKSAPKPRSQVRALYSHEPEHDLVLVLAFRHQREAGYVSE
jgi:predicted transcriptional regulator